MILVLRRVGARHDGMSGVLLAASTFGDLPLCVTLEDPWRDNAVGESCIPAGAYLCKRIKSPTFGWTFEVTDVPGRSAILFHPGNTHLDTRGCILPGTMFGRTFDDKLDVQESRIAFAALMVALDTVDSFLLRIEDCWGGSTKLEGS